MAGNGGLTTDIKTGLAFCTRLPVVSSGDARLGQAAWTFPLIGALIGVIGALVYWLADALGLSSFISAALAVAATIFVTGALHEDGLADTADGFGATGTKQRKLEIMRDSRSGAYGVISLVLSILLRVGALASLAAPGLAAAALIAAHAGARGALPLFMRMVLPARNDGLSAEAGMPAANVATASCLLGLAALLLCLGLGDALVAALLVAAALWVMSWLAKKQVGGQTGDVLGAVEQLSEILILLAASALL
jgi:adenosylcobinamide-GDP ribazoletransferase